MTASRIHSRVRLGRPTDVDSLSGVELISVSGFGHQDLRTRGEK